MKNIFLLVFVFSFYSLSSQDKIAYEKEKFKVWGNCSMCKNLIEKTANLENGVKSAKWNMNTEKLKIKFNSKITSLNIIKEAIAKVGYDTDTHKATDESYNNLHFCCKYEREILKN